MDIIEQINRLKQRIRFNEMADDGYYLSRQYNKDCRQLYYLQSLLSQNQQKNDITHK